MTTDSHQRLNWLGCLYSLANKTRDSCHVWHRGGVLPQRQEVVQVVVVIVTHLGAGW